jgi:predicted dehydrogenase
MPRRIAVTEVNHWHSSYDAAYLQVLRDLDVDIVGVSDTDVALAEDRARRFDSRAFADYRAMIDETKPDFVVALGRHIDMPAIASFLIESDIPFMMEKPMGTTAEDVNALADLAEARGAWAAVPFPNRLLPWAVRAKGMIEAGEFGRISHVVMRLIRPTMQRYVEWDSPWMWDRELAGGGALLNLGGHGMDLARMLMGPDVSVATAVISNRVHEAQVEDYALATLRNGDGALIHVEVGYTWPTWPANESDLEFKVAGEKATLRVVPDGLQVIGPGRDDRFPGAASAAGNYPPLIRDMLERAGRGDPPAITARDCADAMQLVHDAYRLAGRI